MDEVIYQFLIRWDSCHSVRNIADIFQLDVHSVEAALVRLHNRGLAYRCAPYDDNRREWYAIDRYSEEYSKRKRK